MNRLLERYPLLKPTTGAITAHGCAAGQLADQALALDAFARKNHALSALYAPEDGRGRLGTRLRGEADEQLRLRPATLPAHGSPAPTARALIPSRDVVAGDGPKYDARTPVTWLRSRNRAARVGPGLGAGIAAALAMAPRARAAEPVRFAWVRGEGAESCASQEQIADGVTARLGKEAISASASRSIEAIVSRTDLGFRVVLYVRGADGAPAGSRELSSESQRCASIEAAAVLAVALAIDPDAATRPGAGAPARAEPAPTAPPAAPSPQSALAGSPVPPPSAPSRVVSSSIGRPPPPVPSATPTRGAGLTFRAGPGFGLLPDPAPAFSLSGDVALGSRIELAAEALWMPEARTADQRFALGLTAFSLGVCGIFARARSYEFGACGAVWGGALHAVVFDLAPRVPGDYGWAAASVAPRLRIRVAPQVHLDFGAHLLVPFVRRSFRVRGWTDPVFQQPPVTAVPFGGAGIHLP